MTVPLTPSIRLSAWVVGLALLSPATIPADRVFLHEYTTTVSAESEVRRDRRLRAVAGRRSGPVVMVRRGAAAFAPEDSLEACAAAVDYGADGCAIDVRRTRDGVLVLFPDDSLERVSEGFGSVREASYRELSGLQPQWAHGRPLFAPPPTFAALLEVARERSLLLHLDLKEPGLEADVIRLLDQADAWDHVVQVNPEHATTLRLHPRLRLLTYKAPALYPGRRDLDPPSISTTLSQPGQMILVDDPRVATWILGRPPYRPEPYTRIERLIARPPLPQVLPPDDDVSPLLLIRVLSSQPGADTTPWLMGLLAGRHRVAAPEHRVLERAWAAQQLGQGERSRRVVEALLAQARHPSPHPDPTHQGVDAAMAIQGLGRLKATESARELIRLLWETGPAGIASDVQTRVAGTNACRHVLYVLPALGELQCRTARRFLETYVRLSEAEVRHFGPPQYEAATRALLRQRLAWDEIAGLLRSPNTAVRGTALLECLDNRTEERGLALRRAAPWALELPRARQ